MKRVTKEEATVLEKLGFTIIYGVQEDLPAKAGHTGTGVNGKQMHPAALLTVKNVNAYQYREGTLTGRLAKEACEYILNEKRGEKSKGIPRTELSKYLAKRAGKDYVPNDVSGYISQMIQRGILKEANG